ncbi:glycosyltransferase family 2 protein [Thalassobellus sediminis]|uniref:glycosyltransferase family 2 protein n=1 Tax=Thalassobellus sediminis TaxID=3367753 RepID=UPI00379144FE
MLESDLISIIIPTYNRAHLINETLDSILMQTYKNWECIIVDDGSSDNSDDVIKRYIKKDSRFISFKRPNNKLKGANACRNIGLEKANGNYIVFFDSDDLMTPNHLEIKYHGIKSYNCDFVITRTQYFNADNKGLDSYYTFKKHKITPYNYILQYVNWLTYDVCIKAKLAKSIKFNENLSSGQEYNYFSKLVLETTHAFFIDEVVSLRRHHDNSIRSKLTSQTALNESYFRVSWFTYLDIKKKADKKSRMFLLRRCINLCYEEKNIDWVPKLSFSKAVLKEYRLNGIYVLLLLISLSFFGKGYIFHKRIK